MRSNDFPHFVGIDIGTSTVRCAIGMFDSPEAKEPSLIGYGSAPNSGMRKGVVSHIEDVAQAIAQAVSEAERLSGMRIQTATVNIGGAHVSGVNSRGVIAIPAANREITTDHETSKRPYHFSGRTFAIGLGPK